jgi:hypothetical protein
MTRSYGWVIVGVGMVVTCVGFGAMFSLGVFLLPMAERPRVSRSSCTASSPWTAVAWGHQTSRYRRYGSQARLPCPSPWPPLPIFRPARVSGPCSSSPASEFLHGPIRHAGAPAKCMGGAAVQQFSHDGVQHAGERDHREADPLAASRPGRRDRGHDGSAPRRHRHVSVLLLLNSRATGSGIDISGKGCDGRPERGRIPGCEKEGGGADWPRLPARRPRA